MSVFDYYSAFRAPAYNSVLPSAGNIVGAFDPMNGVMSLHERISGALNATDGKPGVFLAPAGSDVLVPFSTYLHELVHWWQHIGTTAGMAYGLSIPVQALATTVYMCESKTSVPKPLIHNLSNRLPLDHPALLAISRWHDVELGASFLFRPLETAYIVQSDRRFFESVGHSMLFLYTNTVAGLATVFDREYQGLPNVLTWIDLYEGFAKGSLPEFQVDDPQLIVPPVSMEEIVEGQARIIELQYLCRSYRFMDWAEVLAGSWLKGVYGKAFAEFLKISSLPDPAHPLDPIVNLFLLLCDIALNPAEGYPLDIKHDGLLVRRIHPGFRFAKLCHTMQKNSHLVQSLATLSYQNYRNVSGILCEQLGWLTPEEVAHAILAMMDQMPGIAELDRQMETGDFGQMDVPLRFYYAQHRAFLKTKAELPHFFCWPAFFLTTSNDEADLAASVQEVLMWHTPPFLCSSLTAGVDTVSLPQYSTETRENLVDIFFLSQVLYDLVRQWISKADSFSLHYAWKPHLTAQEAERIISNFGSAFEIDPRQIAPFVSPTQSH